MQPRKKLLLKVVLIVVGLALIILGIIKIVGGLKGSMVSDVVNKFSEIYNLGGQIGTEMKTIGALLNEVSRKEQAKDYDGAAKDAFTSLSGIDEVVSKFNTEKTKISEFKGLLQTVSDSAVKQNGLELVNLLEQRNIASLDLANNTKQYVVLSRIYYEELASGKTGVKIDEVQANNLSQKASQASQTLSTLTPQVNAAIQNFAKAANLQLENTAN